MPNKTNANNNMIFFIVVEVKDYDCEIYEKNDKKEFFRFFFVSHGPFYPFLGNILSIFAAGIPI